MNKAIGMSVAADGSLQGKTRQEVKNGFLFFFYQRTEGLIGRIRTIALPAEAEHVILRMEYGIKHHVLMIAKKHRDIFAAHDVFQNILEQTAQLFAGGSLSDEDELAFITEMQRLYLDSKERAKKYTPKKYLQVKQPDEE